MTVPGLGTRSSDHVHRLRRSKGCAVCLKRRVKCDEKRPSCSQCLRGRRKCYGVLSTIFFHVELASLSGPANRITRDNIKQAVDCAPEPTIELTWAEPVFGPMDGESDQEMSPKAIAPREPHTRIIDSNAEASKESQNISNSAMEANNIPSIIHQHLSNFVHLYTIIMPRNVLSDTWIDRLPNMLSPTNDPLMGMCITAVSLLYCGLFSNNDSITAESYRWYGTALTRQRSKIKELDNSSKKPTVEEICAPIILSFFEVASGNSHAAQFHHLQGAARLLERHGPTECSEGLLFGLFQTLRLLMIYPTVKIQHKLVFGTEEWRTIPFLRYPRSHIGRIIDIASATSGLLSRVESLITRPTQVREAETLEFKREALDLEEKLNRIWDELWKSNQRPGSDGHAVDDIQSADFASPEVPRIPSETPPALLSTLSNLLPDNTSPSVPVTHQSPFPSEQNNDNFVNIEYLRCLAFYSAARMLVLSILHSVNAAPASYEEQTQGHCARILIAASTMSEVHAGYVYLRLLLPLRVVAIFGTFEQREKAGEIIPKNGLRKGFSGNADRNNIRGTKSG